MRRDIAFDAEGTTLRGWLYEPAHAAEKPAPCIVMAHGFAATKEQYLDRFAEVFCAAGFAALVYDHRNFGASDGKPRQEIDPVAQMRDYRHAITYAQTLPTVDPQRIGVWGSSFSGGHALVLGAIDRRVRCVVAQVPTISGSANAQRRTRPDLVPAGLARFDKDRAARFRGEAPAMATVYAEDPATPCALPGAEAWAHYQRALEVVPNRLNEVTLRSLEMAREYEPGIYAPRISPTPLLMIVADRDTITPTDLALDTFERALHPKKLILLRGGHFSPYVDLFATASAAARDWFVEHLG